MGVGVLGMKARVREASTHTRPRSAGWLVWESVEWSSPCSNLGMVSGDGGSDIQQSDKHVDGRLKAVTCVMNNTAASKLYI